MVNGKCREKTRPTFTIYHLPFAIIMTLTREQICDLTSRKLAAALTSGQLAGTKVTVGLDGFVDEIIAVVDTRKNHEHFDPVRTIDELGEKIKDAAGERPN